MNPALLVSAALMGVLGSAHCAAMCGGISSALTGGLVALGRARAPSPPFSFHLATSAGRVATYGLLGALVGGLGRAASAVAGVGWAALALRTVAALALVGLGLHLAGLVRASDRLERLGAPVWRRVAPFARKLAPARSVPAAFALGGVWGLMPCGLVYGALGLAGATGSAAEGALAMALFGLGTAPALLAVGVFVKVLAGLGARPWVRRFAGATIVVLGLFNAAAVLAMAGADTGAAAVCCTHPSR